MSEKNLNTETENELQQENVRKKGKGRFLWIIPICILLVAASTLWVLDKWDKNPATLYKEAVADAVIADADEIEQLVELTKDNPMTTWDDKGRVLLLSWHHYPDSYKEGESMTMSYGSVWTFTDREIAEWYKKNNGSVSDWELRLEQLIGLPPEAEYTHVSAFWVDPQYVVRPAYITDVTQQMELDFSDDSDNEFREWFEENSIFSYEESAYPWTRLGYTYDWANNGTEYGLTEFLIGENAPVQVAFTKTTEDFLSWLSNDAPTEGL